LEGSAVESAHGAADGFRPLTSVEDSVHQHATVDIKRPSGFHAALVESANRHRGRLPAQAVELKQIRKEDLLEVTGQWHGPGTFPDVAGLGPPRPTSVGESTVTPILGKFTPTCL